MRRPLQVTQHDFDFSNSGIERLDFEDEIPVSNVYTQRVKEELCDVFVAQCQLAVAMTGPISVLYPRVKTKATDTRSEIRKELTACVEGLGSLKIWELGYLMPIEDHEVNLHPTVKLFTDITSLYYQYDFPYRYSTDFSIDDIPGQHVLHFAIIWLHYSSFVKKHDGIKPGL